MAEHAATRSRGKTASTAGASLDFAFFRCLWQFYHTHHGVIRRSYEALTCKFLDFNNPQMCSMAFLRQPQLESLEIYVFLKEFLGNPKVGEVFKAWCERSGSFGSQPGVAGQEEPQPGH